MKGVEGLPVGGTGGLVLNALEVPSLPREVHSSPSTMRPVQEPVGESAAWRRVMAMVEAAAPTDSTVLLLGESGTGKKLLARRLHRLSARVGGPFVHVNCAAIPLELWESEFFGRRSGAFTSEAADREGRFHLAHRGTLLLDGVEAMPAMGQAKLLCAIQEAEFARPGGEKPAPVDARIVASTNSDLLAGVKEGRFRADLYYRLNVVRIEVPPLRERTGDIGLLARLCVEEVSARLGRSAPAIRPEALARLCAHSWPGNIRELRSMVERALILDPSHGLDNLDLPPPLTLASIGERVSTEGALDLHGALNRLEKELLIEAYRRALGVRKEAARLLGIDARNLAYYLRKHHLVGSKGVTGSAADDGNR